MRASILALTLTCGACTPQSSTINPHDFSVTKLPYAKGKIVLEGTEIPASFTLKTEGNTFTIEPEIGGVPLDMDAETYRLEGGNLLLVSAGGETYTPELPLTLKASTTGSQHEWKGTIRPTLSPTVKPTAAQASIMLKQDKENSLKIEVVLSISDGSPKPATRQLAFWLGKDQGIVRREFAFSSKRVP